MKVIAKRLGFGKWMKGRKGNKGTFVKGQMLGPKHPQWNGGPKTEEIAVRRSVEYGEWRTKVFKQDDYRCFDCGERGGKLEADHIFAFSLYKRLRLDVNNGRTLCRNCHKIRTRKQMKEIWKNQFTKLKTQIN